ncbi:MAG: type IV toxin-antitoxin system AbiEi family antitoxin domain-containing protein [Deltaproteobacteria bacterium]|nr:type IV toxin-antitoxin system AbiEi family antitoxin domain-containing protein [Deltaproteobacteria bacterium]
MVVERNKDLKGNFNVRHSLSTIESTLLASLAEKGRNIFTLDDVIDTLGVTYENAKVIVNRLEKKAWLIRLTRGKYLIVPLEAGVKSLYTEHGFVIASHLVEIYYIGYGSALNYHGLSELVPSVVYVATSKRRRNRTILNTKFRFITVTKSRMFGIEEVVISGSKVKISDAEKTVADCLDHPEYCGGIDETAKSIYFEHRELNIGKILMNAEKMGNKTIIKRLGYLLELFGYSEYDYLFENIELSEGYTKLDPKLPKRGSHNSRWRLMLNAEIKPERWMG